MTALKSDTLYFRHDHPNGYLFGEGSPAPDPTDGWVTDPRKIGDPPERTFECSTLEAFDNLLQSERASALQVREQLLQEVAIARAEADQLRAECARLRFQLQAPPEGEQA